MTVEVYGVVLVLVLVAYSVLLGGFVGLLSSAFFAVFFVGFSLIAEVLRHG